MQENFLRCLSQGLCVDAGHPKLSRCSLFAFLTLALLFCFTAGCRKKQISQTELRAVTHELVAAAQEVEGKKAEITIRPEVAGSADNKPPHLVADNLYITLNDPSYRAAIEAALDEVARRHNLEHTGASSSDGVMRFDYSYSGRRTHKIHLITPLEASPPAARNAAGAAPRLAIILDDLGHDRASADALLKLRFPLTVSVIPNLPLSTEVAEEARRRGDEVMLHLPMESESQTAPAELVELRVGMTPEQVDAMVRSMLETVPVAAGVNNHEGSRATADSALMQALMPALRRRGLFFIDSRTTAQTVAYDAAQQAHVPSASRNVFLDDTATREAVLAQINLAARNARKQGSAIAIGHPHPATIAALEEALPKLEQSGIRLVFASDVVH